MEGIDDRILVESSGVATKVASIGSTGGSVLIFTQSAGGSPGKIRQEERKATYHDTLSVADNHRSIAYIFLSIPVKRLANLSALSLQIRRFHSHPRRAGDPRPIRADGSPCRRCGLWPHGDARKGAGLPWRRASCPPAVARPRRAKGRRRLCSPACRGRKIFRPAYDGAPVTEKLKNCVNLLRRGGPRARPRSYWVGI
ncbi:MAG: hypothetical protein KatS3mg050_4981 [Litorilinea sp.]|nr:MAG: hypothetical protein KatS3mg050_4981 [Litorilinea sp.]